MNYQKGFAGIAILIGVVVVLALGGAGYVAMNPEVLSNIGIGTSKKTQDILSKTSISWQLTSAGEVDGIPYTNVVVVVNGEAHAMGKFAGSCQEIGANGGIDGKGLIAGELSAVQCWYAGGGDEIGVFAHEDGGYQIMVGGLSESEEGAGVFRGDFDIKVDVAL